MATTQMVAGQEPSEAQQEQLRRDQLRMAVQKICPVSGRKLGTHGKPIKVKVGKETVFLCCKGCLQQKLNPEHWATIHANFAACLVQGLERRFAQPRPVKKLGRAKNTMNTTDSARPGG